MIPFSKPKRNSNALLAIVCGLCLGGGGCSQRSNVAAGQTQVPNHWWGPMTVAVAPALNFSGTADLDPNEVADLMASELGHVNRINVIPVSRVLAVMARFGIREVASPQQAMAIRELLGADAILIFAIDEYDPFEPPIIGITAQLYGKLPNRGAQGLDPVLVSRQARPAASGTSGEKPGDLIAQAQRVFNAAHDEIQQQVHEFATSRGDQDTAFGWRLYLASQRHYLRFCCFSTIAEMVRFPESMRLSD